jgi:hypothetical protein
MPAIDSVRQGRPPRLHLAVPSRQYCIFPFLVSINAYCCFQSLLLNCNEHKQVGMRVARKPRRAARLAILSLVARLFCSLSATLVAQLDRAPAWEASIYPYGDRQNHAEVRL